MQTANESFCMKIFVKIKNKIQYFGDESNLHGIGYVFSMSHIPFVKRIFWFIILVLSAFGAAAILQASLGLYSQDVVSYSVETNYLEWDTPFPAVTVCEQKDDDRIKSFLSRNSLPSGLLGFFKEVTFWNLKYCNRYCRSCKMNETCVANFEQYVSKIRLNCSGLLTDCWWNGEHFPCCDRFQPIPTEYGICYSFNSLLGNNSHLYTVNRKVGVPDLLLTSPQPILIRVHAPDDVVSVSMDNVLGRPNTNLPLATEFEAILKVEQTTSDISVSSVSLAMRGCLYKTERPAFAKLWPFNDYTYNACILYCRAVEQMELCNCTHYFLPKLKNVSVCDVAGMACLNENKDSLISIDCECPMACEEILYKVIHVFNVRKTDKQTLKRGTRARIRLAQLPALRVQRQAIRGMLGLVVDIGGVGGVFFGASLLSVIEIFYILFIRKGR